jgi:hypothetical protein
MGNHAYGRNSHEQKLFYGDLEIQYQVCLAGHFYVIGSDNLDDAQ